MCWGMDMVKEKMQEIRGKEKPTAVEEDMLVTLEVCYEFYLRGFTFERGDLYRSHAINFIVNKEKKSLLPPFSSIPGLGETAAWSLWSSGTSALSPLRNSLPPCPKVSKTHIEQLKAAGALDGLPNTSQMTLF